MKAVVLFAVVAATAAPALAKPRADDRVEVGDPNRLVCRSEDVIGSRLRRQKRCMTAQEWLDLKMETRRTVERVQGGGWKSN